MYYIRVIDSDKWEGKSQYDIASIDDIVSSDGEVSVWMDDSSHPLEDLLLAYLMTRKQIKDVCCVKIPEEYVCKRKIKQRQEDSSTPYVSIGNLHTNLLIPTLFELGDVAESIYEALENGYAEYVPEQDLKERLYELINAGEIKVDLTDKDYKRIKNAYNEIAQQAQKAINEAEMQNECVNK